MNRAICILLLSACCALGQGIAWLATATKPAAVASGDSCGTANLIFSWHCEDADVGTGSPAGCSSGDTTGTANGGAAISGTQYKDGANSISIPTAEDYYTFDWSSSTPIVLPSAGTVDFWIYLNTLSSTKSLFRLYGDAQNHINVLCYADGMVYVLHRAGNTASTGRCTVGALASGGWYHIKVRWDSTAHSGKYITLTCDTTTGDSNNDTGYGSDPLGTWTAGTTTGTVRFGDWDNDSGDFYLDQIKIYDNWQ